MHRLRSTWLALMGGALLVTLSVSAAFGAAPEETEDGNRGQTIAAFVHELVFGSNEDTETDDDVVETDDDVVEGDPLVEDEDPLVEEDGEVAGAHGECVSEAAQDKAGSADSDAQNHGEWVSEHARELCWETADDPEVTDPEDVTEVEDEDVERQVPEEFANHGACVSEAAQDKEGSAESGAKNHGEWVSEHARFICWGLEVPGDDTDDTEDTTESSLDEASDTEEASAAKADKPGKAKADRANRGNRGGNGHGRPAGRGGGRP